jgi:hypothetical protein
MMLPNFTYAEFVKMVQHIMVRQRILLAGSFKEKRERSHRLGYVLDFDSTPLTPADRKIPQVRITDADMNALVELSFVEALLIYTQLLHISAPQPTLSKPVKLTALGATAPRAKNPVQSTRIQIQMADRAMKTSIVTTRNRQSHLLVAAPSPLRSE